jgi:hypothetical protein
MGFDQDLREAERHIVEAEARIAKQRELIEELARDGHDTTRAIQLLETMTHTLEVMKQHRRLIKEKQRLRQRFPRKPPAQ